LKHQEQSTYGERRITRRNKNKDTAFAKLDDWMSEFYAVPRIGLEDNPQLLESLGKVVK
jgi:hypothetical protein